MCNRDRINNNLIQFLDSTAPHDFPGGGGFGIMQFTLQALYDEFIRGRNWWTKSNCFLPLVRYMGCSLKLYRTEKFDYEVHIHRCYPLKASDELYMSTQPSIMGLTKRCIFVPCRQNTSNKKPYKKIFVKPPTQMTSGWHFQKDIANFPLLILTATAASFDRYFLASNSQSTTIGFLSLNTKWIKLHDWQSPPTSGWHPNAEMYLWGCLTIRNSETPPDTIKKKDLIFLGGTGLLQKGTPNNNNTSYSTNPGLWGNYFHIDYLSQKNWVFQTTKSCSAIINEITGHGDEKVNGWSEISPLKQSPFVECRYNPFADKSTKNKTYVVSNHTDHTEWRPPPDKPDVLRENLPLWLTNWGYLDYLRKTNLVSQVDINYMIVWESPYIKSTPQLTQYVPIDTNFQTDPQTSPYIRMLTASDQTHFYPKVTFQIQTVNTMGACGPGTIKLGPNQSAEAKIQYKFKLKLGGCPAPMETLCDPSDQAKYPIPNFKQQTPSLQSPSTTIQTYLYNFDERRGMLTDRAAKRIKKDQESEKTTFEITGASMDLPTPDQRTPETDTSTSEEEEETTFQLLKLRRKQHKLRQRIFNLISQNIE